ncbi:tetratricopeptide repeat-containing sensor histidine kinase [Aquimarina rhabdastrellae]
MKKKLLFVFFIFCCLISFSQEIDSLYIARVDSLLSFRPKSYDQIDRLLKPHNKDSIYLRYLFDRFAKANYPSGESYAYNMMGIHCRNTTQYPKAIALHKQAIEKAIEADNIELRVVGLNMLGVVFRRKDAIRTALDYHHEALTLAENINPPTKSIKQSIAVSLNSMGNIYLTLKQFDLAIQKFSRSAIIETDVNNRLGLAINHQNIGYAKESIGNLDEALKDYRMSLAFNEAINSMIGKVICYNSIGRVYVKQKKYQQAIDIITPILENAKDLRDKFHLTRVYNNLGRAHIGVNDFKKARFYLLHALSTAKEHNFMSSIEDAYNHLSLLSENENDFKQALFYHKKAQEYNDKISNDKNFQYVTDLLIKYDTEKINNQLKVLEKENEIVKLKLRRDRTIWLISSIILMLLILLVYILYRQRLLNNEKKILTLEQDMLRSQMNPHFIFNSLNSIKQYIISKEQKNAVYYLNKFAKLIRKILEASRVKEVSLAEELETIDLYMSIENIRFSNEIDFQVQVKDQIELEAIKIPSMILQPFLENALWHGLSSKKGEKKITLEINRDKKDFVTIIITDNGIGRRAAQRIRRNKTIKRKSIGVEITKTRLANFVKNFEHTFTLQFKDLKDKTNQASGTQVILQIPLKH